LKKFFLNIEQYLNKFNKLSEDETLEEPPSTILWTKYFLSQHFTKCGNNEKAIEYIDWCIDHTPTVVELYLAKAKIYKNIGDKEKACEFVEEARSLDLADKFF